MLLIMSRFKKNFFCIDGSGKKSYYLRRRAGIPLTCLMPAMKKGPELVLIRGMTFDGRGLIREGLLINMYGIIFSGGAHLQIVFKQNAEFDNENYCSYNYTACDY